MNHFALSSSLLKFLQLGFVFNIVCHGKYIQFKFSLLWYQTFRTSVFIKVFFVGVFTVSTDTNIFFFSAQYTILATCFRTMATNKMLILRLFIFSLRLTALYICFQNQQNSFHLAISMSSQQSLSKTLHSNVKLLSSFSSLG